MNPFQGIVQGLHNFGQNVDKTAANIYQGIHNFGYGLDSMVGIQHPSQPISPVQQGRQSPMPATNPAITTRPAPMQQNRNISPMPQMQQQKPISQPIQQQPLQRPQQQQQPFSFNLGGIQNMLGGLFGQQHPQQQVMGAQAPKPPTKAPTPSPLPGQNAWVQQMGQQHPGQSPQYYADLYKRAVTAPGGHYYEPNPTQAPQAPISPIPTQATPPGVPSNGFSGFTTVPVPPQYAPLIYHAAISAGVDPNVFASLLFSEHGFQPTGINQNVDKQGNPIQGDYDRGMAQINTFAHPDVTDAQANNPQFAVPWSANLLANYIKQAGDLQHGIAAYNVGVGGSRNPQTYNTLGMRYVDKIAHGLTPQTIQRLGLKP